MNGALQTGHHASEAIGTQRGEEYRFDWPKLRRSGVVQWQILRL
jgi:hypothetical protein